MAWVEFRRKFCNNRVTNGHMHWPLGLKKDCT
jgi:hypothetical protein